MTARLLLAELRLRVGAGGSVILYLVTSLVIGVLGLGVLAVVIVAAALSVVWIGLPLLQGALAAARWLAGAERRDANLYLDAQIPQLPRPARRRGSRWRGAVEELANPWHHRVLVLMALRAPLSLIAAAVAAVPIALAAVLVGVGVRGLTDHDADVYVGPLGLGVGTGLLALLLAVPAVIVSIAVLDALHGGLRNLAVMLLAPGGAAGGPAREMIAQSLGDRSLTIAYWLPDREVFVDDAGLPVELPEPGSGRTWTAVGDDAGRPVAAIVHDAALDTSPELVQAAAAAASLAIDNDRLKADLRARVEELRVSRSRVIEAALAARQRIERDLHDGAQQHLVALAIEMAMLKGRLAGTADAPLVEDMATKLQTALEELRELARGIHPAVLTERGLEPAIDVLAMRSSIPVEHDVRLGGERGATAVEATAYFVIAEALTNVAKYAAATHATVSVWREGNVLRVAVRDDGIGGASVADGTGLRGIYERVHALDGQVSVESPEGGGTVVAVGIPWEAAT